MLSITTAVVPSGAGAASARPPLLSDAHLRLSTLLRLPTFAVEGMTMLFPLTMIMEGGVVNRVLHPISLHARPPCSWDRDAGVNRHAAVEVGRRHGRI